MNGQPNLLEDTLSSSGEGLLEVRPRTRSGGTILRNSVSRIAGTLSLDKSEVFVGGEVGVYWDINAVVSHERDWIGMFEADEETPESFLDSRLRGENRAQHGHLSWHIDRVRFRQRPTTEVCFCFYNHCNVLLARSSRLTVINPEASPSSGRRTSTRSSITEPFQIRVTGLYCTGLRSKTFGHPDPYLKLHLTCDRGSPKLPHHGQRTTSTVIHDSVYPCWTELFTFEALPSDILEIEVRDKFSATRPSISHFLGRVHVPLCQFLRWRGTTSLTFTLQKRLPSDRVSGTLSLSVENDHLEPRPEDIESLYEIDNEPQIIEAQPPTNHLLLPPSGQVAVVQNATQDSCSSEEVGPALTSTSNDIIPLTFPLAEDEGDSATNECTTSCQNASHASVEGERTPSDVLYYSAQTSTQSSVAESVQENTSGKAQVDVARPQSEDATSINAKVDAEQVVQKQISDDPQLGQHNQLSWIRQTLYGSRSRRRDVSSLQRHHSLYTPRSHDRSRDFTTSVSVTTAVAESHLPLDATESLPPNWEMRPNASGLPMYFDHQNKVVMLEKPAGQAAAAAPSSSINDFLRRSSRNLFLRQTSNQPPEISDHQEFVTVKLSRSQTVTGGFPGAKPRSTEPDEPVQPDQQDRIESGTTILVAERYMLEPADQKQSAVETIESSEATTDEVFMSEKEEEKVKSKSGEDDERVKAESEGSGAKGVKAESDGSKGERSEGVMRTMSIDDDLRESPAFKFITRPDLYKFAKEYGNMELFKDLTVLELLQTIRSDHALYVKYQHSSKLVRVLNSFAQTECDLPAGWEKKVDPRSKKHVFVDHNTRRTTFIDPRLPYPGNDLKTLDTQQGVVMRSRPFVSSSEHQGRPRPSSPPSPRPPTPLPRPAHTLSPADVSRLRSASFSHPRATNPLPPPPSPSHSHSNSLSIHPRQRIRSSSLPIISSPSSSSPPIPIPPSPPPPPPPPPPPSLRTPPPIYASVNQQEQQDELSYSDQVVAFLRQPNIFDLLRTRHESRISSSLRHAIELIRLEGTPALERMQSEMDSAYLDLTILLSLFEEEISHHIFPVASSQAGARDTGGSHLPPPPQPPHPPPPPPSHPPPPAPTHTVPLICERVEDCPTEVDEDNHSFAGMGVDVIIAFFIQARAYHIVLSRFNGITAVQREYIEWFQNRSLQSVEERLSHNADFRQFIFQLRGDIQPQPQRRTASQAIDGNVLPNVENHTFAGMSIADILEFFQREEEGGNILGMDLLMPLMTELTVEELEDLLMEDEDIRSLVIQHRDEIQASRNRQRPFPSSQEIQSYFTQPHIYSVVLDHLGTITLEDRAMVERIVSFDEEMLEERLLWDSILNRFINAFSDEITAYATSPHIPEAPLPPPIQTNFTKPATKRTEAQKERAFIDKLQALQRKLDHNGYASPDYLAQNVSIRRDHLLEDAYRFIMGSSAKQLRKKKCNLRWDREEGLDYGGPQREFFFKLSRQLFNPYYGLFEYSAHGSYTIQISPQSAQIEDALHWFRFAGRVIGYSIIQGHLLDVFFARHVYKALLGRSSYSLSDVEAMDIGFYNSLKYVLENDPEPLELTFTVLEESFGEMVEMELVPRGSETAVTEDNKQEYVDLMVQWRLARRIGPQTESLVRGLKEMLPLAYLEPFDAQELEWVIAGTPEINIDDWKENTLYWGGYHKNHTMVRWFWEVVESYSNEQKLRLLQFVTGTSSIPFEGFKALRGSSSLQRFTIDTLHGPSDALPIAHTCFNRLDMPYYTTQEALREKLTFAIEECDSFENA